MKNKIWISLLTVGFVLFLTNSCVKVGDNEYNIFIPIVRMSYLSNMTKNSIDCQSRVYSDGTNYAVTERGVCWSKSDNPTIADYKTSNGSGEGIFNSSVFGLTPNTKYYIRAYATNISGTGYSTTLCFTTQDTLIVTDADNNVYHTIKLGTQQWMAENLKTKKYRNGDPIPNITDSTQWHTTTNGAYCAYNNDNNNALIYGQLYNKYVLVDTRKLCPVGWHLPTNAEWTTLINYCGGSPGDALKEGSTTFWLENSTQTATNVTGFTALPGGYRRADNGRFENIKNCGIWWSNLALYYNSSYNYTPKPENLLDNEGLSVRCVKD